MQPFDCTARQCWPMDQNFGECSIFNQTFIGFVETAGYWSGHFIQFFFSAFHWSPSNGKPRMTSVSFGRTMESYEVSLVTIKRQTSYGVGILRQDYGIIRGFIGKPGKAPDYGIKRGLPMNHTRFADWVTIWVAHLPERTETNWPNYSIGPDCAGCA